ncbi:DUF1016 N-terminal domain-containing protein [Leptospira adleri]|uniref:YhcG N-terminal domain-containing protein n=1 Tax=Leptospira adleri TaxID=2023186 RepID=A0A2M9YI89_9LEPT|nr:DUF1016 N-terminal domain-containing protein [Leptospira adleri]PJZ51228.1 hypothetical protein CH380_21200 [Leptospira adleri]PJZ59496.1 hypothetical protein CH376_23400 [Leptospira adleri]
MDKTEQKRLVEEIKQIYEKLKESTSSGNNQLILEANRSIGKMLTKVERKVTEAEKGNWIQRISSELKKTLKKGFSERSLFYSYKFYQVYGEKELNPRLNWSHYRLLCAIRDEKLRTKLEAEIIRNNWSREELGERLRDVGELSQSKKTRWKRPEGELFHYKIKEIPQNSKKILSLDLGFYLYHSLDTQIRKYHPNDVYEVVTHKKNNWSLLKTTVPSNMTYCYFGEVERVIDGDTLLLRIDLGFNLETRQRIRLSRVWAAELDTGEGDGLYHQLSKKLPSGTSAIVKTKSKDIYGRYVGDVLYSKKKVKEPKELLVNGIYLNEELSHLTG